MRVEIQRLPHAKGLPLPEAYSEGAAGMDLAAAVPQNAPLSLEPGGLLIVPTGFCIAIPKHYEGQIRPRSGFATRHRILIPNSPGTIDCDYRGELLVPLLNLGTTAFSITRGLRIAQLVIGPVSRIHWEEVDLLPHTWRGVGGFGSTGGGMKG